MQAQQDNQPSKNNQNTTILVIGAGIIGRCCALQFASSGHAVTLLDDDPQRQAPSWGNAGHIATEQTAPLASPNHVLQAWRRSYRRGGPLDIRNPWASRAWITRFLAASTPSRAKHGQLILKDLLAEALPAWRRLDTLLGGPSHLIEHGHVVVWESARNAHQGRQHWQQTDIGNTHLRAISADELKALSMASHRLSMPIEGIGFSGSAQIRDPLELAGALDEKLQQYGVKRLAQRALHFKRSGDRTITWTDQGPCEAHDRTIICAGVQSQRLLEGLAEPTPLVAERGYHLQWDQHQWPSNLPPVVFEDRSIILTRFQHSLRLAGFVEIAPLNTPADPSKWARLQQHAEQLGLPVQGTPQKWMGARPTLPDYLPGIGQCIQARDVFYAVGHQHLGLTLAATTAEQVVKLVNGSMPASQLQALSLQRFA